MKTKDNIGVWLLVIIVILSSCKKDDINPTVTDIDGNVYKTITIGTQIWMAENLKSTKYSNGDLIGTTTPATFDISGESTPKYQWAYDGNESNVATYGRLYTWYAVTDSRNVCPTGWHVPTDSEWTTLTTYLGGESVAGGKLKETGTTHWQSPNQGATNGTGFTALPGGWYFVGWDFMYFGSSGVWWSTSENWHGSTDWGWMRALFCDRNDIEKDYYSKNYGMSVRCIKNN